jgi:hypothetical protein
MVDPEHVEQVSDDLAVSAYPKSPAWERLEDQMSWYDLWRCPLV